MKNSKINIYLTFYVLFTLFFYCLNNSNNISIHKKSYNINYKIEDKTFYVKEEITYSLKNSVGNTIKNENENYLMRIKQYFSNQYSNLLIQGNNINKVKIENDKEYIIANVQFNYSFNKEIIENGLYLYKLKYSYNIHRDINFLLRDNTLVYEDFDFFLLNKINENSSGENKFKTDLEIKFHFNESDLSIEEKDNSLFYRKNKNLLKSNEFYHYNQNNNESLNSELLTVDPISNTNLNSKEIGQIQNMENSEFIFDEYENSNYLQNTDLSRKEINNLNNSITLYFKDLLGDLVVCSVQQGKIEKNSNTNQYIVSYKFSDLMFGTSSYEKIYATQIFNSLAHKELEKFIISNNIIFYIFSLIFFIITTFVLLKILLSFRAKESVSIDTNLPKSSKKVRNDKIVKSKKSYDLDLSSDSSDEEIESDSHTCNYQQNENDEYMHNEWSNGKKDSNNKINCSIIDTLSLEEELKTEDIIIYQ